MRILWLLIVATISGCSLFKGDTGGPRVADVLKQVPRLEARSESIDGPNAAEVLRLYEGTVEKLRDREQRYLVAKRIAELKIEMANEAAIEGAEAPYREAIASLEQVLEDEQASEDLSQLRYQLARAYDLAGQSNAMLENLNATIESSSDQETTLEARFRRAELYFSLEDYWQASEDYAIVASFDGTYRLHATYMLGWSRFKQSDFDHAVAAYIDVIEYLSMRDEAAPSQEELFADTTRVSVMCLDYLDGPETLAALMAERGKPNWQVHLYQALGDWYREKERFQDSIATWQTFLADNPLHERAPHIALEIIETWRNAGFVAEIPASKRAFVEAYDKRGAFYRVHGDAAFDLYADSLREFLEEIIAGVHAEAQRSGDRAEYLAAARQYERWLANFEGDERSAEMRFLMAEALADGGDIAAAIDAFRVVSSKYPDHVRAREATYAVIVYLEQLASAPDDLLDERIDANLDFATRFANDERAPAAQVSAARLLFDAGAYVAATEVAEGAIESWPSSALWENAARISAHARFETQDFDGAEGWYRELLARSPKDHALRERLMATVFKQAEGAELAGELALAIERYSALSGIDASSALAIDSSYDIAALYERLGQFDNAVSQLERFRSLHPDHVAVEEIPMRLVALYERQGNVASAAHELLAICDRAGEDSEVVRQALYRAGELFLAANNSAMAIDVFRRYAHAYPMPFDLQMEAMHQLDVLYQDAGAEDKRRFWLNKEIEAFAKADASTRSERTRYLAAAASLMIAQDKLVSFDAIPLRLPLKKSLKNKKTAMIAAVKSFDATANYGVAEFVTASTYHTGHIYRSLARSIIDSDRPRGLNELELEQYELLLEEQAFPIEEQAIAIHEVNLQRGWQEAWDEWIDLSLEELAELVPGRFQRETGEVEYVSALF